MIAPLELTAAETANFDDIDVEDRGAPVTVFAFAGAMKQLGGVPIFEFRNALRQVGTDYNLVLLRDVHRSYYQLRHDGAPGGLDYYAARIEEIRDRLRSVHHVTVGTSMGATAALYFGARCRIQHVIAFGPNWPILADVDLRRRLRDMADLRTLMTSPRGYWESLGVMQVAALLTRRLKRKLKGTAVDPMVTALRQADDRLPSASIYYGARCPSDVRCSRRLAGFPSVSLIPVSTGLHNVAGYLKRQGLLFRVIKNEIDAGYLRTLIESSAAKPQASGGTEPERRHLQLTIDN
jgi:pimeloyl-ACP methyl ester carboxylesterase